jgi:hypothetical protein
MFLKVSLRLEYFGGFWWILVRYSKRIYLPEFFVEISPDYISPNNTY